MFRKNKLSYTIAATIGTGLVSGSVYGTQLEEIVVTASKRASSLQDVPIAVQALDGNALQEQNVSNFDDYIKLLPNVTAAGRGPGQSAIYIRGLATDAVSVANGEVAGTAPNVALYLDEQPVSTPSRNLDVYVTDVERIEVLPGPQGTLFGASSQAGTVRIITNKPQLDVIEGSMAGSVSFTERGEMSNSAEAVVNIPIIRDQFAFRGVFYSDQKGGYIDNEEAGFSLPSSNPAFPAGATIHEFSNAEYAEEDFNDSSYQGFRAGLKYAINDDWSVLLQNTQQELKADGVFDYDPNVGDLKVERFYTDELKDSFSQTSLTIEGRLGALDLLYTAGYLDRDTEQRIDYSGYNTEGPFVPYYICDYPAYTECGDPTYGYNGFIDNRRQTHEFRITTPEDHWVSAIVGVFYDEMDLEADTYWYQPGLSLGDFPRNAPISTSTRVNPEPRPEGVTFINDITRFEDQHAVFGELTFNIGEQLSVTFGARWYNLEVGLAGSSNFNFRGATDGDNGRDIDAILDGISPDESDDTIGKFNISWTPNDDSLFYFTYAEGFRPGGFNRRGGITGNPGTSGEGIVIPNVYTTDNVDSYELGWKLTLLDGSMQFNGALYHIDWTDMQVAIFNSVAFGNLTNTFNVGDAEIQGIEGDITWQATDSLLVSGAFSYNIAELVDKPAFATNIVDTGEELALSPELQANIRGRYEWGSDNPAYVQAAVQYSSDSFSSIVIADRFEQDSWVTLQAAVGINVEEWNLELFGENLTDERAELYINTQDGANPRTATNRPRTIGLRVSHDF